MPTLCLLRHAKAAHPSRGQRDFDRGLTDRGRDDAARMATALTRLAPDIALISPAARTQQTWEIAGRSVPDTIVSVEPDLYLCTAEGLVALLRLLPENIARVVVVGHNPGLHELALWLAGSSPGPAALELQRKFPTASLAEFAIDAVWAALTPGRAHLTSFVTPGDIA